MFIGNLKKTIEDKYVTFSREITWGGVKKDLWIKLQKEDSSFFIDDRIDGFVCALLPTAMALNENIESNDPLSESLYCQFEKYLIPFLVHINDELHMIHFELNSVTDYEQFGGYVAGGMSRGLDSFL